MRRALSTTPSPVDFTPDFEVERLIRFADCDPAGIVFYPQYFVMFNGLVEDWFSHGLGVPFVGLITERQIGVPTAHLSVDFRAISRFGETVRLGLRVARLGSRSIELQVRCVGAEGAPRVAMRQVLVMTSLATHQAIAVPADIRATILTASPHLAEMAPATGG